MLRIVYLCVCLFISRLYRYYKVYVACRFEMLAMDYTKLNVQHIRSMATCGYDCLIYLSNAKGFYANYCIHLTCYVNISRKSIGNFLTIEATG
jgi:hypothetical protein